MTDLHIVDRGGGSHVLVLDGQEQSFVDLNDPTRLVFDYVRRLGDALDLCFPPGQRIHVTHVGGAAMTLPRYVTHMRPTSAQVVFEPHAPLVALTRGALPLPRGSGIKVRVATGRAGIATLPEGRQDAVLLDAFADGRVPGDLVTSEFFAQVALALTPDGVFMLNLVDRPPFGWTRRVVSGLRQQFDHLTASAEPSAWKARRGGNIVVLASRGSLPVTAWRDRAQQRGTASRILDDRQMRDTLGGATPFTDAETEPSPRP